MARNVFVSFLGTNNYLETYYDFQGDISPRPVRFIQEALVEILCGQWTQKDKILIFCTALSKKKNWIDNGQEDTEVEGLSSRLKRMNLPVQTEMVEKKGFLKRIFGLSLTASMTNWRKMTISFLM